MPIVLLVAIILMMPILGASFFYRKRVKIFLSELQPAEAKNPDENPRAEEETGADLPWWLPISFLQFRMPLGLFLFTLSAFAFEAALFEDYWPRLYLIPWSAAFWLLSAALLIPLLPDLFYETARLFSRGGIRLTKTDAKPRSRAVLIVILTGFLLGAVLLSVGEWSLWSNSMDASNGRWYDSSDWSYGSPGTFKGNDGIDWIFHFFRLMLIGSTVCGGMVWGVSEMLFRFRSCSEGGGKKRNGGFGLLVAVLRSFSIPTAVACLSFFVRAVTSGQEGDRYAECGMMSVFLYGWMVGLHLWMATIPLMLLAKRTVPWWAGVLLLGIPAVMPVVILFR